jgi:nicotinate-nucleotide pyrophosphorylase (carboxylating)
MPTLRDLHIDEDRLQRLIALAKEEDLGAAGDITTQAVSGQLSAVSEEVCAQIVAREEGVVCGLEIAPFILAAYDSGLRLEKSEVADGDGVKAGTSLGRLRGDRCAILSCERVVLNFMQRLSGIATQARRFVDAVAGTGAKIYDTRKTTPGLRDLEKYAVRCGGGHNHRHGLHDAILVKDNHLAGVSTERLAQRAFEILNTVAEFSDPEQAKRTAQEQWHTQFVEFEVDSLEQFEQLLKVVGIDVILLDNFSLDDLRRAVQLRDRQGLSGKLELEASGGITLETVPPIAETGVERISVGALTHSAAAMDISLEFDAA